MMYSVGDHHEVNETSTISLTDCHHGVPYSVEPGVRVVVGVTCLLSMFGALLIILSYILIRDIRTKAREILVHLSLMDFMAAAANFTGIIINFDQYLSSSNYTEMGISEEKYHAMKDLCLAQASFAVYGTISSVLWTICIAVYIYLRIMNEGTLTAKQVSYFFYVLCYGIPCGVTVWYALTGKLGYARYGGSGWCSMIVSDSETGERQPLNAVFGNDIWIYLTIILVPTIFISLHFYLRNEMKNSRTALSPSLATTVQSMEMKLLFIPVCFILLRIWSLLFVIIEIEAGKHLSCFWVTFFLYAGGIGDSGQGFANAILFCLFTPKVRRYFFRLIICYCCWRQRKERALAINSTVMYGAISQDPNGEISDSSQTPSFVEQRDAKSLLIPT